MNLIDIFFPKFCIGCGFLGTYLCLRCQKQLVFVSSDSCFYCRKASFAGFTHPGCTRQFGVDAYLTVCIYNPLLKKIIKTIKYRLAKEVSRDLLPIIITPAIVQKLLLYKRPEQKLFLQSIPLHPTRMRKRGFNQSDEIAKYLAEKLPMPVADLLERHKNTQSQAQLKGNKNRFLNMRRAFSQKESGTSLDADILLTDDIVTSGSTVREAVRVLKQKTRRRVFVFALAKG